jgi:hypothetical protein
MIFLVSYVLPLAEATGVHLQGCRCKLNGLSAAEDRQYGRGLRAKKDSTMRAQAL